MAIAYLGIGSNLGNRERNITRAIELLAGLTTVERVSSLYESAPLLYEKQPPFLNAACQVATGASPVELLRFTQRVEREMGRVPGPRYGPRPLDIDILLYGQEVLETADLVIPHPAMHQRAFVLVPLAEIAPEAVHPVLGRSVAALLASVQGKEGVVAWRRPWP